MRTTLERPTASPTDRPNEARQRHRDPLPADPGVASVLPCTSPLPANWARRRGMSTRTDTKNEAAPCAARLAGDRTSSANGEPINEQDTATASGQTTPAPTSEPRYLMSLFRWTPEGGAEPLACGTIDAIEVALHTLRLNGVNMTAFGRLPNDQQAKVYYDVLRSGVAGQSFGQRPARVN